MHEVTTVKMTLDDIHDYVVQSQKLMTFAVKIAHHLAESIPV